MDEWWRGFGEYWVAGQEIDRLDDQAEAEAESAWKLLDLNPGARVLDAPCGFGRHAVRLATWGFQVWGVDLDPGLLAEARRRADASGANLTLAEGDLRALPLEDGWADAVLNLDSSIGLFETEADNDLVVTEAFRVLAPGGRLLIETAHRESATRLPESEWVHRADGTLVLQRRSFDLVSGRLHTTRTIVAPNGDRTEAEQNQRVYSLTEIAALLRTVGFGAIQFLGGFHDGPPTRDANSVVVATKPG